MGYRYTGFDIAPGMVQAAKARAFQQELEPEFLIGDIYNLDLEQSFDAVVLVLGTYFRYVNREPLGVLQRLRPHVRKKAIVDWNRHNAISFGDAFSCMEQAGFKNTEWRLCLDPQTAKLPSALVRTLPWLENVPIVRSFILKSKGFALTKGEV